MFYIKYNKYVCKIYKETYLSLSSIYSLLLISLTAEKNKRGKREWCKLSFHSPEDICIQCCQVILSQL